MTERLLLPEPIATAQTIFRLAGYSTAKRVSLAGSFNGWSTEVLPLTRTEDAWICFVDLPPGRHRYKLVVDSDWILDPENPLTEESGNGSLNSVLVVKQTLRPFRIIAQGLLITAVALLWTLVLPGVVASIDGVYYKEGIRQKISQKGVTNSFHQQIGDIVQKFEDQQAQRREQIALINSLLDPTTRLGSNPQQASLLELRGTLQKELDQATPPVSLIPFHLNPQMLLWPAIYTCLGWLVFLFRPFLPKERITKSYIANMIKLGLIVYFLYEWPLWLRNFVLTNEARTVYAYPNFDISRASFFVQEGIILAFCFLLVTLWRQWASHLRERKSELAYPTKSPVAAALDHHRLNRLSAAFIHWLSSSVILALGFLFFTNFFWTLVARYHDQRYFLSALNAHLLWGISWVLISLPLIYTWIDWEDVRTQALTALTRDAELDSTKRAAAFQALAEVHPLNIAGVAASGIAALVSFVLPLMKLFF